MISCPGSPLLFLIWTFSFLISAVLIWINLNSTLSNFPYVWGDVLEESPRVHDSCTHPVMAPPTFSCCPQMAFWAFSKFLLGFCYSQVYKISFCYFFFSSSHTNSNMKIMQSLVLCLHSLYFRGLGGYLVTNFVIKMSVIR